MYFPTMFDDSSDFQSRVHRKERILAMCEMMLEETEEKRSEAGKKLFKAEQALLKLFEPKNFGRQENYEVAFEKNFQVLCHSLNSHTNENVKQMTVLEVYSLMEMLKKQNDGRKSN